MFEKEVEMNENLRLNDDDLQFGLKGRRVD
jgi:hypothetical protein